MIRSYLKPTLAFLAAGSLIAVGHSCGDSDSDDTPAVEAPATTTTTDTTSTTAETVTVSFAINGAVKSLDSGKATSYTEERVLENVFPKLLTYAKANSPVAAPQLAEALPAQSADGLVYTVKIKQGLTWADGTSFDSADVTNFYRRAADLDTFSVDNLSAVTAVDAHTVNFTFTKASIDNLNFLTIYPIVNDTLFPQGQTIEETALDVTKLGGLGPFVISSADWNADESSYSKIVLAKNDSFTLGTVPTVNVEVTIQSDLTKYNEAVVAGTYDVSYGPKMAVHDAGVAGFTTTEAPAPNITFVQFRTKSAPFNDVRARQAVAYLVPGTFDSALPDGFPGQIKAYEKFRRLDRVEKGKALLAELGYTTTNKLTIDFYGEKARPELTAALNASGLITATEKVESIGKIYVESNSDSPTIDIPLTSAIWLINPYSPYSALKPMTGGSLIPLADDITQQAKWTTGHGEKTYATAIDIAKQIQQDGADHMLYLPISQDKFYFVTRDTYTIADSGYYRLRLGSIAKK